MRIAGDEQVGGARGDGGAQHTPLRRVKVLGLIDDDVPVGRPVRAEQVGSPPAEMKVGALSAVAYGPLEEFDGFPEQLAAAGTERHAAPVAGAAR